MRRLAWARLSAVSPVRLCQSDYMHLIAAEIPEGRVPNSGLAPSTNCCHRSPSRATPHQFRGMRAGSVPLGRKFRGLLPLATANTTLPVTKRKFGATTVSDKVTSAHDPADPTLIIETNHM